MTGTDPWRPYEHEPVLTPAMTGGHSATPVPEMDRLRRYVEAVVADRQCPVHTAVAFNAAYFGYELAGEGYGNGAFDIDAFPTLTLGDEAPALPVGALVRIETGSDPLYAEIVHREGRHSAASEHDHFPSWVSGAPAGATGAGDRDEPPDPLRRELLVPDFMVFGPALQLSEAKLARFRARQKWLDKDGHVVVDARYASTRQARLDPTVAFVDHLLTHQRESLLSPLVPVSIVQLAGGTGQKRLQQALAGLLDTVAHALRASDALRCWGHYALTRTRIGAGLTKDGPLGGADLRALTASVERAAAPPAGRRHNVHGPRTTYTAVGPWLRGIDGAEPLLTGVEYAVSVCRANLALADFVRGDTDNGLCGGSGVRITLDDGFEGGGVWRSHHPGAEESDGSDPLVPAGRGWRDALDPPEARGIAVPQQRDPAKEAAGAEPVEADFVEEELPDAPLADERAADDTIGGREYLRITDSEVSWQIPLRLVHLAEGRLPLSRLVRDGLLLLGMDRLSVQLEVLHHNGNGGQVVTADLTEATGMLRGLQWPADFFPGIRVYVQWPRGGTVFRLSTVELGEPVEIDGEIITHRYDPQVLTRDGAPGSSRSSDSAVGLDSRSLVLRAVRRCGLLTPDGHALLDRVALPRVVYASVPSVHQHTALERALGELLAAQHLYAETGSRGADGQPHYPARDDERPIPLIGYEPSLVAVSRSGARHEVLQFTSVEHFVHGFVRRLPHGWEPTDAQRDAYREHCRHVGKADGWELPAGYTFVTAHSRRR
ncbi:hypothetical protein ACYCCF_02115 [Streptomyces argenteolus]|uniref:hypothetical protein n=1 Tax=Streptomyces sp. NPDC025273 TaxID=3155251 RepID=UPI0033E9F067